MQTNSTQQRTKRAVSRVALGIALALQALSAPAQTARDVKGATPLVAIQDEAPAKLIVDPPIPEQLALGRVFIQYRTENLRILPVFNKAALAVSPRVRHLHYYVDRQSWPTVESNGETVVLVGLAPGPHTVRLELADATHKPIAGASQVVEFTVPTPKEPHNYGLNRAVASSWLPGLLRAARPGGTRPQSVHVLRTASRALRDSEGGTA